MKTDIAVSHSEIIDALPFSQRDKSEIEDKMLDWFDGVEFYWVSFDDSYNFDSLPEEVKTLLRVERPADRFIIYLDR